MKKLLTIALALVMVLALAVPAMAVYGWEAEPATTSTLSEGFTLTLDAYEYVPATTGFNWQNNYYTNWNPTTGIVTGSNVRFVATIDAVKNTGIQKDVMKDIATLRLTVSSSNLYIYKAEARKFVQNATTGIYDYDSAYGIKDLTGNYVDNGGKFSWKMGNITDASKAVKVQVMFVASIKSTADTSVTATLKCGTTSFDGEFHFTKNGQNYTVLHAKDSAYYYIYNDLNKMNVVRFTVDSANKVTDIHVSLQDNVSTMIQTVTPLSDTSSLRAEVEKVYTDLATKTTLDPFVIGFNLWMTTVTDATKIAEYFKLDGTTYTKSYANKTDAGLQAYKDSLAAKGITLSAATSAQLKNYAILYIWDTLKSDTVYLNTIAALNTAYSGTATAATGYAGTFASVEKKEAPLWRAVLNDVLKNKHPNYVYYANSADYLHFVFNTTSELYDIDEVDNIFVELGGYEAASLGQIGVLGNGNANLATYYRASYNVNTGLLTFGHTGEYSDGGYQIVWKGDAAGSSAMETAIVDDEFKALFNTYAKGVPVYAEVDEARVDTKMNYTGSEYYQSGSIYNALKSVFTEITGVLAFNWDGTTSYMYPDAFIANFAAQMSLSQTINYTAYAAQLIVADPNAQPPQTGDASSILGFVMIALAVVAAGAVVVKKVRA